jgi:predicted HTH domain antitoxin
MTVTIPDEALQGIIDSPEQLRMEIAVALYANGCATVARARKIAGLPRVEMQRELARRRIPMHYSMADYEDDLRTIQRMPSRVAKV